MKTLRIVGVSLFAASMGFVVTAPVSADEVAVSLSAIMNAGATYEGEAINTATGVLNTPSTINSLSVAAAVGSANAMAGGFTEADNASAIAGAGIATGILAPDTVTFTGK
jgi:hypothetical protein